MPCYDYVTCTDTGAYLNSQYLRTMAHTKQRHQYFSLCVCVCFFLCCIQALGVPNFSNICDYVKLSQLSGVTVEVNSDHNGSSVAVTVSPYVDGTAPYRIENLCTLHSIKVRQRYARLHEVYWVVQHGRELLLRPLCLP